DLCAKCGLGSLRLLRRQADDGEKRDDERCWSTPQSAVLRSRPGPDCPRACVLLRLGINEGGRLLSVAERDDVPTRATPEEHCRFADGSLRLASLNIHHSEKPTGSFVEPATRFTR